MGPRGKAGVTLVPYVCVWRGSPQEPLLGDKDGSSVDCMLMTFKSIFHIWVKMILEIWDLKAEK